MTVMSPGVSNSFDIRSLPKASSLAWYYALGHREGANRLVIHIGSCGRSLHL